MADTKLSVPEETSSAKIFGYILIGLILLSLGGGAWLIYNEYKRQNTMPAPGAGAGGASTPATAGSALDNVVQKVKEAVNVITTPKNAFPLTQGSKGDEVKTAQRYMNVRWKTNLDEDGIWGGKTTAAFNQYEKTSSITALEFSKLKKWLDTFPHDFTTTIKPKDIVINQNTPDAGYL